MNSLAQILALSLGLTLLPRVTAILAKGSLIAGNESSCAVNCELMAAPSVIMETSYCTVSSEVYGLLDFDRVVGAERFLGGIT